MPAQPGRAGARRRTRHRVAVGAVAVAVLAVLAGAVTWLPQTLEPVPADSDGAGVDGYPAHVAEPWATTDLPASPGPMAMTFKNASGFSWWVAAADGHSWPVPQVDMIDSYPPALSMDGRMLGYLADLRTYVIEDLVSGEMTEYPGIGDGRSLQPEPRWFLASQNPNFWSPDGRRLLLRASTDSSEALVLDTDAGGTETELDHDGFPAGWLDDDTVALLVPGDADRPTRRLASTRAAGWSLASTSTSTAAPPSG